LPSQNTMWMFSYERHVGNAHCTRASCNMHHAATGGAARVQPAARALRANTPLRTPRRYTYTAVIQRFSSAPTTACRSRQQTTDNMQETTCQVQRAAGGATASTYLQQWGHVEVRLIVHIERLLQTTRKDMARANKQTNKQTNTTRRKRARSCILA
jgi:hypothetical protein